MPKMPPPPNIPAAPMQAQPLMVGLQPEGAALRQKSQADKATAFGGSLLGSRLQTAQTGSKTLLGQTG